jgi:hypothetical protein
MSLVSNRVNWITSAYKRSDPLIIHWCEAKPFQITVGIADRQSVPDIADGWNHPITREYLPVWDLPTLPQLITTNGCHA